MAAFTVKHSTAYPGGAGPGYRSTVVLTADRLREYLFHSDHDGGDARGIATRPASSGGSFRRVSPTSAAKLGPNLEATIKAHLALRRMASETKTWTVLS